MTLLYDSLCRVVFLVGVCSLSGVPGPPLAAADRSRPHIVVILADDMGYGDPGCYNPESKCPTPQIDALAAAGMRFTDAHAAGAWCTPSRYGLLTGRYAFRTSLAWQRQPVIDADVATIANVLGDAGYQTAMVGKWHLGFAQGDQADLTSELRGGPCDRGFDSFFGLPASLDIPDYYWIVDRQVPHPPVIPIDDSNSPGWSAVQGKFWRAGRRGEDFVMEQVLDQIGEQADARIESLTQTDKPFFLYVPLTSPHTPWLPGPDFADADQAGLYSQFVNHTDAVVGRIVASLERNGIAEQTLVLFSSDNGPVWYESDTERFDHDSMGGLRGMKGDVWEAGHRIPLIVRWPGKVPAETVCDQLISFVDLHATLAEIAGTKPADSAVDSLSFAAVWHGETDQTVRNQLVCFQEPIAFRSGPWKLVTKTGSAGFLSHNPQTPFLRDVKDELNPQDPAAEAADGQLYNLDDDRAESVNVWNQHPDIVKTLRAQLTAAVE